MPINIYQQNKMCNKGFTLMEILVTIAIFSLIMIAIGTFARNTFYYNNIFSNGLTSYDEANKLLQPIASEIRSASPSSLGAYNIESATDTSFVFFTDTNNDGLKERVRYFLSGTALRRGVIAPTGSPLKYLTANEVIKDIVPNLKNGTTAIFTYYDTNYNGSTAPMTQPVSITTIRLVKITLIIDIDPNRSPIPVTISTQVSLRNLKDNL
jgi:prepilin-type N-terminal cleavage/methylation domain-containing protein